MAESEIEFGAGLGAEDLADGFRIFVIDEVADCVRLGLRRLRDTNLGQWDFCRVRHPFSVTELLPA
jgi:hypothetical protein